MHPLHYFTLTQSQNHLRASQLRLTCQSLTATCQPSKTGLQTKALSPYHFSTKGVTKRVAFFIGASVALYFSGRRWYSG